VISSKHAALYRAEAERMIGDLEGEGILRDIEGYLKHPEMAVLMPTPVVPITSAIHANPDTTITLAMVYRIVQYRAAIAEGRRGLAVIAVACGAVLALV
jgi:hypothetical protein